MLHHAACPDGGTSRASANDTAAEDPPEADEVGALRAELEQLRALVMGSPSRAAEPNPSAPRLAMSGGVEALRKFGVGVAPDGPQWRWSNMSI